jgi:hypothetical protein
VKEITAFWNWGGQYIGYRLSDSLFNQEGQEVGHFAEGDEIYGSVGEYLGEVRGDRLITNLSKKAWTRGSFAPLHSKSFPGHPKLGSKEMLAGFEDFPVYHKYAG